MKIVKVLKEKNISEFILIIFLVAFSLFILKLSNFSYQNTNFLYSSKFIDLIHILKIDIAPETSQVVLYSVYKRYIILFLGGGYLTYLILLTILFHRTCKDSILYVGPLYFSLATGSEILSYVLPFNYTRIFFTSLSWIFTFCGYIRFIRYFWGIFFDKKSKIIEWLTIIIIIMATIPLSLSIKEFYEIYFNESLVKSAVGIPIFFNYFKSGFIATIILLSFISWFYNRNKNKKTESGYYFILFLIQFIFNLFVYNKLNLYGNFEFMAHLMVNILFVHVQLEDIKLTTENQFFRNINFNAIRILITFITISYFAKQLVFNGYTTLLVSVIILVETVSFIVLFFSEERGVSYDNFLNRLKYVEDLEDIKTFMETELTKMFRLIKCKVVFIPLNVDSKNYDDFPIISFSPVFNGEKYDFVIKIQNRNKVLGFIYIKDPWMLLYKKKFKNFKYLILQSASIIENISLKTLQINYYKKSELNISKKLENFEKDIFYIKELLTLLERAEGDKKVEIIKLLKEKAESIERGEK